MSQTSECRSCGVLMRWVRTASGKAMPLNAEPDVRGNVTIEEGVAVIHPHPVLGQTAYMPHHATCPQADQWRR